VGSGEEKEDTDSHFSQQKESDAAAKKMKNENGTRFSFCVSV
jgi:hypothetical protein